jgi:hypothetical protein
MVKRFGGWHMQVVTPTLSLLLTAYCLLLTGSPVWADDPGLKAEVEVLRERLSKLEEKLTSKGAMPSGAMPSESAAEIPEAVWPVSGIYTVPTTKDLGALTGISWLSGTKVRGWVDTNYVFNFNTPDREVVNANNAAAASATTGSVVKGRDVSVEGRTFDIHHNSLSHSLSEVEVEKVPEIGGVGFKFDMAFGETQDVIVDSIKGSVGTEANTDSVTDFDKTFQHASVSYLAPIGRGLRFDVGKFVTHIGGETIETAKNWNYSHAFFYTYAIPFQDTGIHVSYPWSDTFYTDLYILNGWNTTIDNNKGKSIGPSIGWIPMPWLSIYTNYLGGPEQAGIGSSNFRHLWDTQVFFGPFDRWNFALNYDIGWENDALNTGTKNAGWNGLTGFARYKVNDWFEPSLRVEYYKDGDGFTTGMDQGLWGYTLTLNTKLGLGKSRGSMVLFRPEIRYDRSSDKFFTQGNGFRNQKDQFTLGAGLTWLF